MSQKLPVITQIYWPAAIEQFVLIGLCAIALQISFGTLDWTNALLICALGYLAFCRTTRFIFARAHYRGINAYRAGDYGAALAFFHESFEFFSKHPRLDRYRSLLLGVSSHSPYRRIALGNIGYCYSQLGEGETAIEYYERVLAEDPENAVALSCLRMLRSTQVVSLGSRPDESGGAQHSAN